MGPYLIDSVANIGSLVLPEINLMLKKPVPSRIQKTNPCIQIVCQ